MEALSPRGPVLKAQHYVAPADVSVLPLTAFFFPHSAHGPASALTMPEIH